MENRATFMTHSSVTLMSGKFCRATDVKYIIGLVQIFFIFLYILPLIERQVGTSGKKYRLNR